MAGRPGLRPGTLLLALVALAAGAFFAWQTGAIQVSPAYSRIGPRVVPWLVAGGLGLIGLVLAAQAWRGVPLRAADDPVAAEPVEWVRVLAVVAGLLLDLLLLERLGFVLASTIMFALVAAAFASRRHLRDLVIGFVLSVVVYVAFTRGLALRLPGGFLAGWF